MISKLLVGIVACSLFLAGCTGGEEPVQVAKEPDLTPDQARERLKNAKIPDRAKQVMGGQIPGGPAGAGTAGSATGGATE